jgi:pre-rRNA-processing protein TSR3
MIPDGMIHDGMVHDGMDAHDSSDIAHPREGIAAPGLDVLILRDPRESTRKCSLTPLRGLPGIQFLTWKIERRFDVGSRILLHADGEEITAADAGRPLLLIDCAWRRVPQLLASCDGDLTLRRLPKLATAYPRKSLTFVDPEQGLASIEALYAALALLGRPRADLMASYRWADEFLAQNPSLPR